MTLRNHLVLSVLFTSVLLAACSRPTAFYQPSKAERFYTQQSAETVPGLDASAPAIAPTGVIPGVPDTRQPTTGTQPTTEVVVSLKTSQSAATRTALRMTNAQLTLTGANPKMAPTTGFSVVKKLSLVQRMTLKHIDKTLKKHLAPREGQALTGYVRLGLIIAAIGLILLLIGNSLGTLLGLLGLLGGLALVVVGLLQQ